MKFIAEKAHMKQEIEIQAPFVLLLIFSQLNSKVSDADLCRAKDMSSWDHKGCRCNLQVQGEKAKSEFYMGSGLPLGGKSS